MPNPKDTLLKVKDLPSYDGLRLVDGKLIIPDAEIVLSENASHAPVNTLSKNHLNLGSGENTMYLDPATFTLTKDIPADVEQGTDAEYYKIQFDTEHNRILIYDTDRLEPKIQIDSSGIRLNNSLITGITSQSGSSTSLAASQSMVSGKQDQLTAGANINISQSGVISANLNAATNIISIYPPDDSEPGTDGQLYIQYNVNIVPEIDPETGDPVINPDDSSQIIGTEVPTIDKIYSWIDNTWCEITYKTLYGTTAPTSSIGEDGCIYLQYNSSIGQIDDIYCKINDTWYKFNNGGLQLYGLTVPVAGTGNNQDLYMQYDTTKQKITHIYGKVNNVWYEFNGGTTNLFGTTAPTSDLGEDGSIYMQYNNIDGIVKVYGKINGTWYQFKGSANYFGNDAPLSRLGDDGAIYMRYNASGIIQVYGKINGSWYPFPSFYKELTRTQYNALTPEEKNNGTIYFVTNDADMLTGATPNILYGTIAPTPILGSNGSLYIQYENEQIIKVYCKINGTWLPFPSGGGGQSTNREYSGPFSFLNSVNPTSSVQNLNITFEEVT